MNQKKVYVISSRTRRKINEREQKLLQIGEELTTTLVCRGEGDGNACGVWEIEPHVNPTGILRKFGMGSLKKAVDRWIYFPSPRVLYANAVYRRLRRQIRRDVEQGERVTMITCLPAHDLCVVGLRIKTEFPQVRWICDWQDLWSYDDYYLKRIPNLYRGKLRRLEKLVFDCCDMNVTTNPYAQKVLVEKFGVSPEKCRSIYHPFNDDESVSEDWQVGLAEQADRKRAVRMVFLGTLFKPPKMPGDRLLRAMKYVRSRGIDVQMDVYGSPLPGDISLEGSGTSYRGYLRHEDIPAKLREYDLLVLIMADLPNCKVVMNIKLPSYFAIGKPICAIVPKDSVVAEMIRKTGTGYVVPAGDEWGEGLYRMLSEYLSGAPLPSRDAAEMARFSWRNLSREWREVI